MNIRTSLIPVAIALLANAAPAIAEGETITVTIAADVIDVNAQTATVADLPGPDGTVSFSEALIAANNTPGHQTIGFAIPPGGWLLQFLYPGRAVLTSITGFYFRAYEEVTIDGTTQTGAIGDTNPDGCEVVIHSDELYLLSDNCTLIGFDSTEVILSGSNGVIEGNTGTMDITVGGGPGTLVKDNTGGTLKIQSSDTVVVGNTFQRLRVLGATNAVIGGPAPEDRNHFTGYGTWNISSGLPSGTTVQLSGTVGTVLENNRIGTTPDGLAQGNPASTIGVSFEGTNHDVIVRNNLIAGIRATGIGTWAGYLFGHAVIFWGSGGSNIELTGNTIGLDANGDPLLGSVWGIDVGTANGSGVYSDVRIGGALPGQGNVVAGHVLNGVSVGQQIANARISGNPIYANGAIGIDLQPAYGVTPNDPLDADTGGNGLQNFPESISATRQGANVRFVGSLHSAPVSTYTIEIFASPECDESGFGEGSTFLGTTGLVTDAVGDGAFDVLLPATIPGGWVVTATATLEPIGATSEFSACTPVGGSTVMGDLDGDGLVDTADLLMLLADWGGCAGCAADLNGDTVVSVGDLLMLLAAWQPT